MVINKVSVGVTTLKKIYRGTTLVKDFTVAANGLKRYPYKIGYARDDARKSTSYDAMFGDIDFITAENGMGMNHMNPGLNTGFTKYVPGGGSLKYDFAEGDAICEFAILKGAKVNGAHLTWHGPTLKAHVTSIPTDYPTTAKAVLTQFIQEYITAAVTHFKTKYPGTVVSWNVMNESIYASGYKDSAGVSIPGGSAKKSFFKDWFTLDEMFEITFTAARAADPSCVLLYNDYDLETSNATQGDALNACIDNLKAKNIIRGGKQVTVDGIGFQFHSLLFRTEDSNSYTFVKSRFKRWADKGLYVHVSELDCLTGRAGDVYTLTEDVGTTSVEERLSVFYEKVFLAYEQNVPAAQRWGITMWSPSDSSNFINSKGNPFSPNNYTAPGTGATAIVEFPCLYDYFNVPKTVYYRLLARTILP